MLSNYSEDEVAGTLAWTLADAAGQERITATAVARKPAGIVLYADPRHARPETCRILVESGIPVLFLIRMPDGIEGSLLTFENADGITGIVKRFYQEGCRRFALFVRQHR